MALMILIRSTWHVVGIQWALVPLLLSLCSTRCLCKCCVVPLIQHVPFQGVLWIIFWFFFLLSSYFHMAPLPPPPPTPHPLHLHKIGFFFFHFNSKILHLVMCYLKSEVWDLTIQVLLCIQGHTHALLVLILKHKITLPALFRTRSAAWGSGT